MAVKQENLFFKQSIQSMFEILSLRLGEENKKSFYLEKDVQRLKSDIKYLEKMSQEYTNDGSQSELKTRSNPPNTCKNGDESSASLFALNHAINLRSQENSARDVRYIGRQG